MDYQNKTKFEINRLVAQALGMRTNKDSLPANTLSYDYNNKYPDTVWAGKPDEAWEQCCWTSIPEQWAELVAAYSINLTFDTCQVHAESYFCENGKVSMSRKDIGLAVAIAYLKYVDYNKMLNE
jgi:hypothetical protein